MPGATKEPGAQARGEGVADGVLVPLGVGECDGVAEQDVTSAVAPAKHEDAQLHGRQDGAVSDATDQ